MELFEEELGVGLVVGLGAGHALLFLVGFTVALLVVLVTLAAPPDTELVQVHLLLLELGLGVVTGVGVDGLGVEVHLFPELHPGGVGAAVEFLEVVGVVVVVLLLLAALEFDQDAAVRLLYVDAVVHVELDELLEVLAEEQLEVYFELQLSLQHFQQFAYLLAVLAQNAVDYLDHAYLEFLQTVHLVVGHALLLGLLVHADLAHVGLRLFREHLVLLGVGGLVPQHCVLVVVLAVLYGDVIFEQF